MQPKSGDATILKLPISIEQLVAGQAVFGFFGVADDGVSGSLTKWAGVVTEADQFGQARMPVNEIDVRDVVEIEDRADLAGVGIFAGRRVVGGGVAIDSRLWEC